MSERCTPYNRLHTEGPCVYCERDEIRLRATTARLVLEEWLWAHEQGWQPDTALIQRAQRTLLGEAE